MPNRARNRGDYLERQTKAALIALDWVVVRSAGSLGAADLIALRWDKKPLLISCKITGTVPPAERMAIREAAAMAGARPVLATRVKRGWVCLYLIQEAPRGPEIDHIKVPAHAAR
jgi:Holliday junction resolvase